MREQEYRWNEKLWKPIVRPPRHHYNLKDLGSDVFKVKDIITKRTDFEIYNDKNQKLQFQTLQSLFEPVRKQEKPHPYYNYNQFQRHHYYQLSFLINIYKLHKSQKFLQRQNVYQSYNERKQIEYYIEQKSQITKQYLHGNSSSRIESFTIIEYLIPADISVCGIDLSGIFNLSIGGSGLSEGEYISLGYYESKDVICLYDYLRENKKFITSIGLWGRSMGSVTAILAANHNQDLKVLVCDSPFSNITQLCQEFAKINYKLPNCCFNCFWCYVKSKIHQEVQFNIDELNIVQIIQVLPKDVQILFLSALQDDLIRESHSKLLMKRFRGEKKDLFSFDGTHNSKRPAKIMEESVKFVCQAFGQIAWTELNLQNQNKYSQNQLSKQTPLLRGDRKSVQPYIDKSDQQ